MSWARISLLAAALFCAHAATANEATSNIDGVWMRSDGNARVEIAPCGDRICATNLWIGDTSKGENVGDELIMTLSRTERGDLVGTAYDPKRGWTYGIAIERKGTSLFTRGCILGGLLCKSVTWAAARP